MHIPKEIYIDTTQYDQIWHFEFETLSIIWLVNQTRKKQ